MDKKPKAKARAVWANHHSPLLLFWSGETLRVGTVELKRWRGVLQSLLGQSNLRLARVAVLGDQVAGETGKLEIYHFALTTRSQSNHFARAKW